MHPSNEEPTRPLWVFREDVFNAVFDKLRAKYPDRMDEAITGATYDTLELMLNRGVPNLCCWDNEWRR